MQIDRLETPGAARGWPPPRRRHRQLRRRPPRASGAGARRRSSGARRLGERAVVLDVRPAPGARARARARSAALMTLAQKAEILGALGRRRARGAALHAGAVAELDAGGVRARCWGPAWARSRSWSATTSASGAAATGDARILSELGRALWVRTVAAWRRSLHPARPISSTRVRAALAEGDVGAQRGLLGRRFFVDGAVVGGRGPRPTPGFPTANLATAERDAAGTRCLRLPGSLGAAAEPPREAVVNLGDAADVRRRCRGSCSRCTCSASTGPLRPRCFGSTFVARLREEQRFPDAGRSSRRSGRTSRRRTVLEKAWPNAYSPRRDAWLS